MSMLREAIDQNNAFPHGIFWTVPSLSSVERGILEIITYAKDKGLRAGVVETGTFDEMLSKIWRQVKDKPQALDGKVRTASVASVSIPLPTPGRKFPILRTNALPVLMTPPHCGVVELDGAVTFGELQKKCIEHSVNAIWTYTDKILFWGSKEEITKMLPADKSPTIKLYNIEDGSKLASESTFVRSFFEETIASALCVGKPLFLRRKGRTYYAVVRNDAANDKLFLRLRNDLGYKDKQGYIAGNVPGLKNMTWAECVSIQLEERSGKLWVMLRPDIWIKPLSRRQEARDFLRKRRLYQYNNQSYRILDAWIEILLGEVGSGNAVKVSCFKGADYSAEFEIVTRTAYSRGGIHGS